MNKSQLAKSVGTLVRLQPPEVNAYGAPLNDDWRIVDVTTGFVELENARTSQRTRIALDGLYTFHDDANRTTTSQRFGFLLLHVEVRLHDTGSIDVTPLPSPRQPARDSTQVVLVQALPASDVDRQSPPPSSPALSVRVATGTANVRGRLLHSADVVVENSGGPCTLVAYSTLAKAAAELRQPLAKWEYYARPIKGAYGQSVYSVATLEPPDSSPLRIVKVRGEEMAMRERYEGVGQLWFDVEWEFYLDDAGRLAKVLTCASRVLLNEQRDGFLVELRDKVALAVGKA